ncbi:HWE histidine kinase domain-containing protein [Erythrobacter sp.]|jgi:two-component sensor histidine kinase|uniref:HWE histidine kinase domain-containing protein n=1 Tax=Erythrobacter sp. TaxID=1042 RepID=UPI002ECD2E45|nr:HWE histidine kinase domain-containing protein [Erythrobacter sp.]
MSEHPDDPAAEMKVIQQSLAKKTTDNFLDGLLADTAAQRLNLFQSMFDAVPVGLVVADRDGRIIYANDLVEDMVRHPVLYSPDAESYGEWVSFHEDGRKVESREYPLARVILEGEEHAELDVSYQRGDGTRFWMRIIGRSIRGVDGELIGATVALIDIDEERRLQKMQRVLIGELNHRVKNAFSVVKSIVAQSLRNADVPAGLRTTLDQRLNAYATAHARLVSNQWDAARLDEIAREIVSAIAADRVSISGPPVLVPTRQALAFSMAFYELATNALKYGALSEEAGRVDLAWTLGGEAEMRRLNMHWDERGGPPCSEPKAKGFGSFVTGRALAAETGGKVTTDYLPTGLKWSLDMPADKIDTEE